MKKIDEINRELDWTKRLNDLIKERLLQCREQLLEIEQEKK